MTDCVREQEVLEVLARGPGPAELDAHVEACATCAELTAVARAILDDASAALHEAAVPSSGAVWWRIERRARAEASRTASRTVSMVQIATVVAAAAMAVGLLGGVTTFTEMWSAWSAEASAMSTMQNWSAPLLLLALATVLLLTPVAVYFAVTEE